MPRFVLIDHWLDRVGGHNYQYAMDILQAAEAMGYEPVLAVNRRFASPAPSAHWLVYPLFRYGSASRHWLGPDGKCKYPVDIDGRPLATSLSMGWGGVLSMAARFIERSREMGLQHDRRTRIEGFSHNCAELFQNLGFHPGDLVLMPSVSEFDFLGIVRFLKDHPQSRSVDWHLQFHFEIFEGREHEYGGQAHRLERFRRQFHGALAQVPDHRLHFYCPTERIAGQYNRMGLAQFQPLPYPVNRVLERPAPLAGKRRLRVTCAGAVRREKGRLAIRQLLRDLLHDFFASGRLQLVIQTDRNALGRLLPKHLARRLEVLPDAGLDCDWPVVPVAFPLDSTAYAELIRQADIGLFLYDARRYYARCSGVLVEMLAAGVPVIVPAGCWLAEQISEPIYGHLDALIEHAPVVQSFRKPQTPWRAKRGGLNVALSVPDNAREVVVRFRWSHSVNGAAHAAVSAEQFDGLGNQTGTERSAVLGPRVGGGFVSTLFPLNRGARRVRLSLTSAYDGQSIEVSDREVIFLGPSSESPGHPGGSVGLIAATARQVPALLQEMAAHYQHYRETASVFARQWGLEHGAERTIEILQANCRAGDAQSVPSSVAAVKRPAGHAG